MKKYYGTVDRFDIFYQIKITVYLVNSVNGKFREKKTKLLQKLKSQEN